MTEIIKPDSNDQSWWTRSLTVVRNVILSYIEDDMEEKENLWPQHFGWVLCLWSCLTLLTVKTLLTSAMESGMSSSHKIRDRTWWRILCLSDHNLNVACTIYQHPDTHFLTSIASSCYIQGGSSWWPVHPHLLQVELAQEDLCWTSAVKCVGEGWHFLSTFPPTLITIIRSYQD